MSTIEVQAPVVPLRAVPDAPPRRPPRPGLVDRPRLVRRLAGAPAAGVAVLVAPAGYGKSTLLRQWELADPRPFTWITPAETAALGAGTPASVFVIDDLHALRDRDALRGVGTLADRLGPGSLLVLASRTEPALPLGRLRAEGALVEMRSADLAMTTREAATLLRRAGVALEPGDLATLMRHTEGWPAGLVLAALALREQPDRGAAAERFAGDDRIVADYLREEVLSALSVDEADFVERTSLLGELTGPLCDAVLDRTGSARLLRDLSHSSLLLAALDRAEERFRYHGMLAEMLQSELHRAEPDRERDVHRRASAWHERQGDDARAIDHAIAAGDGVRAGELIWALAGAQAGAAVRAPLRDWVAHFRDTQIAASPALALAAATDSVLRGRRDEAERWTGAAERVLPPTRRDLRGGTAVLRAMIARHDVVRMRADAERAYRLTGDDDPWRAMACLLSGVAHHLTDDRDAGRAKLEEGARRGALAAPAVQALCLAQLALAALEDDDAEQAGDLADRARRTVAGLDTGRSRPCALVFGVAAFASAQRGEVERARQAVLECRGRLALIGDVAPWYDAEVHIALARAELRLSNSADARTLLAEASRALHRTPEALVLQAWIDDAWARADTFAVRAVSGPSTLTTAELRVLRFLPSHLSFREVAARLHVSANTVKTQAHAVYRKLDASSRSEAVARAREVGLIDG